MQQCALKLARGVGGVGSGGSESEAPSSSHPHRHTPPSGPKLTGPAVGMLVGVVVVKLALFVVCYRWRHVSGSIRALAFDHVAWASIIIRHYSHHTRACESCLVLCSRSPPAGKESKRMFAPVSEKRLESSKNTCMTEFTSDAPCRLADAVSNCVALLAAVLAGWEQGLGFRVTVYGPFTIHATRSFIGSSATLIIRRDYLLFQALDIHHRDRVTVYKINAF